MDFPNSKLLDFLDNLDIPKTELNQRIKQVLAKFIKNPLNYYDELFNLLAQNHSGVYYQELYYFIDFLILLLENSKNNPQRATALRGLLNDYAYFEADNSFKNTEIDYYLREKLNKFRD